MTLCSIVVILCHWLRTLLHYYVTNEGFSVFVIIKILLKVREIHSELTSEKWITSEVKIKRFTAELSTRESFIWHNDAVTGAAELTLPVTVNVLGEVCFGKLSPLMVTGPVCCKRYLSVVFSRANLYQETERQLRSDAYRLSIIVVI